MCAAIPAALKTATCKHGFLPAESAAGIREMGFGSSPGAVQGLQCAPSVPPSALLQSLQPEHGLSPPSSAACLGMSNLVMFYLVISQNTPAVGEESGTETMAENSAFREHWCFPKGKG